VALHAQWEALVKEVLTRGKSDLVLQLLQRVCHIPALTGKWSTQQLDDYAIQILNTLQAGAAGESEKALLHFLIAGEDPKVQSPVPDENIEGS